MKGASLSILLLSTCVSVHTIIWAFKLKDAGNTGGCTGVAGVLALLLGPALAIQTLSLVVLINGLVVEHS